MSMERLAEPIGRGGRAEPWPLSRSAAGALGILLVLAFFSLSETHPGLMVRFLSPFTQSSTGELYFWLGHALLLVPAGALLGFATARLFAPHAKRVANAYVGLGRRESLLLSAAVLVVGAVFWRLMNLLVMAQAPITDEESSARFAGKLLASGNLTTPANPLFEQVLPNRFLYLRDGQITGAEWLGSQVAWAVGEVVGLGPIVFTSLASVPVVAVAYVASKQLGKGWGALAGGLCFLSPMVFALSLTSHTHVLSRAFLSLTFALAVWAQRRSARSWFWVGLGAGIAFLCRPVETIALLLPFGFASLSWLISGRGRQVAFLVLGGTGPVLMFLGYNYEVTGMALLPPRFAPEMIGAEVGRLTVSGSILWNRFGANLSYNLFMMGVWFLGPLGVLLVALGATNNTFTKLLSWGVAVALLVALAHDNYGIHAVGPIHYSECAVPLLIIAVHGLHRLKTWCAATGYHDVLVATSGALVVGLLVFNAWQTAAFERHSRIHDHIYGPLDSPEFPNSVVLVPDYRELRNSFAEFRQTGSFVFDWRRPEPDVSDRVLLVRDNESNLDAIRNAFPGRAVFRLRRAPPEASKNGLVLEPVLLTGDTKVVKP